MRPTDVYTSGDDAGAAPAFGYTLTYYTCATRNAVECSCTAVNGRFTAS
jgi:hypothetical protein